MEGSETAPTSRHLPLRSCRFTMHLHLNLPFLCRLYRVCSYLRHCPKGRLPPRGVHVGCGRSIPSPFSILPCVRPLSDNGVGHVSSRPCVPFPSLPLHHFHLLCARDPIWNMDGMVHSIYLIFLHTPAFSSYCYFSPLLERLRLPLPRSYPMVEGRRAINSLPLSSG